MLNSSRTFETDAGVHSLQLAMRPRVGNRRLTEPTEQVLQRNIGEGSIPGINAYALRIRLCCHTLIRVAPFSTATRTTFNLPKTLKAAVDQRRQEGSILA